MLQRFVQDGADLLLRGFTQLVVGAPTRLAGGDLRRLGPPAVDVTIEVVLHTHAGVEGAGINARGQGCGLQRAGRKRQAGDDQGSFKQGELFHALAALLGLIKYLVPVAL